MSFAANLSVDSVVDAINNQKILAAGSRMSVQIDNDHVTVSTYRQTKETDKTNKIQAIFIAKAIMDLAPSVTRVSVYFFDSASSLSKYKQINVTSGDIKAYEGDQLTQDQLLSSIEIKDGQLADESSRISNYVGSRKQSYQVEATIHDNEVLLRTYLEGATPPEELKYQALKLAAEALTAASESVHTLRVDFIDPTDSSVREVVFQSASVNELRGKLSAILGAIPIVAKRADVSEITVVEGVSKEQRVALLERIKTLSANGVGVTSFLTLFKSIEQDVPSGDSIKVGAAIEKLSSALAQQEQASKDAKNRPVSKAPEKPKLASTSAPKEHLVEPKDATRWALGGAPLLLSRVISDPDAYLTEIELNSPGGTGKAEDDPKYAKAVLYFWKALQANNRPDDAVRFQQKYNSIISRHPAFSKP